MGDFVLNSLKRWVVIYPLGNRCKGESSYGFEWQCTSRKNLEWLLNKVMLPTLLLYESEYGYSI